MWHAIGLETNVPIEVELNTTCTKGLIDMRQMSESEEDRVDLLALPDRSTPYPFSADCSSFDCHSRYYPPTLIARALRCFELYPCAHVINTRLEAAELTDFHSSFQSLEILFQFCLCYPTILIGVAQRT
jgi:hypothetical protein